MYYLIETKDQLERFFKDEGDECYLQFITNNGEVHPKLQSLCALYIYSFSKEKGFIISFKILHKYIRKRKNKSLTIHPPPFLYGYTIYILSTKK